METTEESRLASFRISVEVRQPMRKPRLNTPLIGRPGPRYPLQLKEHTDLQVELSRPKSVAVPGCSRKAFFSQVRRLPRRKRSISIKSNVLPKVDPKAVLKTTTANLSRKLVMNFSEYVKEQGRMELNATTLGGSKENASGQEYGSIFLSRLQRKVPRRLNELLEVENNVQHDRTCDSLLSDLLAARGVLPSQAFPVRSSLSNSHKWMSLHNSISFQTTHYNRLNKQLSALRKTQVIRSQPHN